ncbi:MAG TPA: DNA primase [Gammaproteobacteria bacterium]|nr:DNA primase [Gammaproteobacteria bacterium]MCH76990.1 DNA primase [Gammaproteobacteria bacterium]
MTRVDVPALLARVDLAELVGRYVELRRAGSELVGLCPFHAERTPSFTVNPAKGFVHCFGCGAHHDAVGFVMAHLGLDFKAAVRELGGDAAGDSSPPRAPVARPVAEPASAWVPLMPVPDGVPELMDDGGWTVPIWNPKRGRPTRLRPVRLDAYRDSAGRLLGYVARAEIRDRDTGATKKWTPMITWCVSRGGEQQWCLQAFAAPRPLLGLDDLAAKPAAPVLVVEGESCRAAGAGAWPQYAVVCWPGGTHGIGKVDWRPLAGRDVVLWPDADEPGLRAMLGHCNDAGDFRPGVAHYATRAGARSVRMIDTTGRPQGWDLADALQVDGWTPQQAAAWAATRRVDVRVVPA